MVLNLSVIFMQKKLEPIRDKCFRNWVGIFLLEYEEKIFVLLGGKEL